MDSNTLTFVIFILFSHYIGDYIFQTRKQADNKHHDFKQLFFHVGTYSLVLLGMLFIGNYFNFAGRIDMASIVMYVGVNFLMHLTTDFFTSRKVKELWSAGKAYQTFVVMGLDQFIHAFCLIATSAILFH